MSGGPKRARMVRVDQAGEYGATRIYAGQLAVLGSNGPHAGEIAGKHEGIVGFARGRRFI